MTSKTAWGLAYAFSGLVALSKLPVAFDGELNTYWQVSFAIMAILSFVVHAVDIFFDE